MINWEETLLFAALRCRPAPRRPVWLMRQAGRYLPEYRALRKESGGFLNMVKTPEIACEITLQPVRRFGFDAAIIFSDILTIPDALGLGLHFVENEGPRFTHPLTDETAINKLSPPPPGSLDYAADACRLARENLPPETPLLAFCGSPWTLACYMIDGGGGAFLRTRALLHSRPELLQKILKLNAQAAADLLCAQIKAGAQAAMIFDSWGGLLGGTDYEPFSLVHIAHIVKEVRERCDAPVIVFARNCSFHLPKIAACGCDAVGVDWQVPLSAARRFAAGKIAVQGNTDPAALLSTPEAAAAAARRALEEYGNAPGHIFNLGHGVDKTTPPENVAALVEAVREFDTST